MLRKSRLRGKKWFSYKKKMRVYFKFARNTSVIKGLPWLPCQSTSWLSHHFVWRLQCRISSNKHPCTVIDNASPQTVFRTSNFKLVGETKINLGLLSYGGKYVLTKVSNILRFGNLTEYFTNHFEYLNTNIGLLDIIVLGIYIF